MRCTSDVRILICRPTYTQAASGNTTVAAVSTVCLQG